MGRVYVCSVITVSQLLTANGGLYWQERACEPILVLYIHILFLSCKAIVNMFRFQHFSLERLTYEQNQFLNPAMCMYTWVISRVQICNRQLYHSDIIHHLRSTSVIASIYGVQAPSLRTFIPANLTRYVVPLSNIVKLTLLAAGSFTGCIILLLMSPMISYSIVQDWIAAVVSELTIEG